MIFIRNARLPSVGRGLALLCLALLVITAIAASPVAVSPVQAQDFREMLPPYYQATLQLYLREHEDTGKEDVPEPYRRFLDADQPVTLADMEEATKSYGKLIKALSPADAALSFRHFLERIRKIPPAAMEDISVVNACIIAGKIPGKLPPLFENSEYARQKGMDISQSAKILMDPVLRKGTRIMRDDGVRIDYIREQILRILMKFSIEAGPLFSFMGEWSKEEIDNFFAPCASLQPDLPEPAPKDRTD